MCFFFSCSEKCKPFKNTKFDDCAIANVEAFPVSLSISCNGGGEGGDKGAISRSTVPTRQETWPGQIFHGETQKFISIQILTFLDAKIAKESPSPKSNYQILLSDPSGTDLHLVFSSSFFSFSFSFSSSSHLALLLLFPTSTCPRPPNPYIF